jgi:hypothetical protein
MFMKVIESPHGRVWNSTGHGGGNGIWRRDWTDLLTNGESGNPVYGLSGAVNGMLNQIEIANAAFEEVRQRGEHTEAGQLKALADAIRRSLPSAWRELGSSIAAARQWSVSSRARIEASSIDASNVAEAFRRDSIRRRLASMGPAKAKAILLSTNELAILEAVLEIPEEVSSVRGVERQQLIDRRAEIRFPGDVELLKEVESAIETAGELHEGVLAAASSLWKVTTDRGQLVLAGSLDPALVAA